MNDNSNPIAFQCPSAVSPVERKTWLVAALDGREGPLGNTTNLSAPLVSQRLREAIDRDTGEIVTFETNHKGQLKKAFNASDFRDMKYALQATAREVLPDTAMIKGKERRYRVCGCLRSVISSDKTVQVFKSQEYGKCHFGGLMVCGSVWTCPVCAAKITEKKAKIITDTIQAHTNAGGDVLLITFTAPHTAKDRLDDLLKCFKAAESGFAKTKAVVRIKEEIGFIEPIKSLEITYGQKNGWHPHSHQLWFVDRGVDVEELKRRLFPQWAKYCVKRGLEEPNFLHGLDIRKGLDAGEYIAKMGWNAGREVAKGHTKKAGADRYAPFDLLEDYLASESDWSKDRFQEYAKATFGSQYISRFPKLQSLYEINDDKSDEELSTEKDDLAILLGELTFVQWRKIVKTNSRAVILSIAEKDGFIAVCEFIKNLSIKIPPG